MTFVFSAPIIFPWVTEYFLQYKDSPFGIIISLTVDLACFFIPAYTGAKIPVLIEKKLK